MGGETDQQFAPRRATLESDPCSVRRQAGSLPCLIFWEAGKAGLVERLNGRFSLRAQAIQTPARCRCKNSQAERGGQG